MAGLKIDRLRFLIVDDDQHLVRLVRNVLRSLGATEFREAFNGEEAMKVLENYIPDVLIIDWRMAPINGVQLTQYLRNSERSPNPYMPIMMMSSYSERGRVLKARDAGVTEFLVKPVSAKTLFSRIQAMVEKPRQFVRTKVYFGPDRRRKKDDGFTGTNRRGSGEFLPAPAKGEMTQGDVNELFNPN